MKALLLHHPYVRPRFEQDLLDRLLEHGAFDLAPADLAALSEGRIASASGVRALAPYDAVIMFVAFSALQRAPALDWQGYGGLRVMFEHDAIQNYSDLFDPKLKGAWPPVFRKHRFDLMVTSGGVVRDRFMAEGIAAEWLPKAFEPRRFFDLNTPRAGLTTYGSEYRCRVIAERAIVAAGLPLERVAPPYEALAPALTRFLACMAVSSDLLVPVADRAALDAVDPLDVPMAPGLEPMAKMFEAAGAGCCPVVDAMDDLGALGFVDGQTAITFRTHSELVEKLRGWFDRPGHLRRLGANAARLAHSRHTWSHRAAEFAALLERRLTA